MRLVFSTAAQHDITEVVDYISLDSPVAFDQRLRVEEAARRLLDFPALGRRAGARRRRLQVPGTPFWLLHQPQRDAIVNLRVWHGARQWPPRSR